MRIYHNLNSKSRIKLFAYMANQDDPRKCTSAKLRRMHLINPIRPSKIPRTAIVLNPVVKEIFTHDDARWLQHGLVVIDCSWKRADTVFLGRFRGINKRLPTLLAANPSKYGHRSILNSVEALAAALYISGIKTLAEEILSKFKWGPNFLILNRNPLDEYASAKDVEAILRIEEDYFPT